MQKSAKNKPTKPPATTTDPAPPDGAVSVVEEPSDSEVLPLPPPPSARIAALIDETLMREDEKTNATEAVEYYMDLILTAAGRPRRLLFDGFEDGDDEKAVVEQQQAGGETQVTSSPLQDSRPEIDPKENEADGKDEAKSSDKVDAVAREAPTAPKQGENDETDEAEPKKMPKKKKKKKKKKDNNSQQKEEKDAQVDNTPVVDDAAANGDKDAASPPLDDEFEGDACFAFLLEAMQQLADAVEEQQNKKEGPCQFLFNLPLIQKYFAKPPAVCEEELIRAETANAIVSAMQEFPSDRGMQFLGCCALRPLLLYPILKTTNCDEGVAAVIAAMKQFPEDKALQCKACLCLQMLATCAHGKLFRAWIVQHGGAIVLTTLQKQFYDDANGANVRDAARRALNCLYAHN